MPVAVVSNVMLSVADVSELTTSEPDVAPARALAVQSLDDATILMNSAPLV